MPSPEVTELALAYAISSPLDLGVVRSVGLMSDDFSVEVARKLFSYLTECELAERRFPTKEDKVALWGIDPEVEQLTDVYTLAMLVRKEAHARLVRHVLITHIDLIDQDPDDAALEIVSALSRVRNVKNKAQFFETAAVSRYEELEQRARDRAAGVFTGWPMGLPILDAGNMGMLDGQFTTILGKTGVGKSWLLQSMCTSAYRKGARVLYISPEMNTFETELRVDVLMMGAAGIQISHEGLSEGVRKHLDTYRTWSESLKEKEERWITVDADATGGFTVGSIYDLVSTYRPDVLAIDGFYLLTGKRGSQQGWELIKANADGIKALGQLRGIATVCVNQAQRGAGKDNKNPGIDESAYSHAIIEASDRAISLAEPKGQPDKRLIKVIKLRGRAMPMYRGWLDFRIDNGVIRQLSSEEVGGTDEEEF